MKTAITIVLALSLAAGSIYGTDTEQPPPIPAQEQPEVLTRGPVHEAFAEPINLQVQGGLVAPFEPPANIVESPPAERPEGPQYVWIPGYWAWDSDRHNYIWVSACWRAVPPNIYWVPGYWSRAANGWEWVSGFWAPVSVQEIQYLPSPPVVVDVQPIGPPPSIDVIWVPPCHYWYGDHYVLRAGYWLHQQPGWVWVASHNLWTPRGYVFVEGHWDFSLERRGVLFAPVYFPPSLYMRPRFVYSPSIVIDIGALQISLFAYPRYSHYYFGDYYDDAYLSIGIYPWFESERRHIWYDPFFLYARWHHRDEPRWEEQERHEYDLRRSDRDLRPPRTYHEMETRQASMTEQQRKNFRMAEPLTAVAASKETSLKFEHINSKEQQKIATQATEVSKFREERNRWESAPARQKTAQPPTENKGPVTQPSEHKEPVPVPEEHKGPVTQPSEHKERVPAPEEHKGPVTQPSEHKEPVPPPAEHKEQVTQPKDTNTPVVPPREVHITQPERVKVPAPPIVGRQGAAKKGPPPRPVNERKDKGEEDTSKKNEVKDTPKENQRTNDTNDANKDKDKGRGKGKGK